MIDYKNYKEPTFKRLGREAFFWVCCFAGAGVAVVTLLAMYSLLYLVVPQ